MKGKLFTLVLAMVVAAGLLLYSTQARATIAPELAVESVFSALNSGNVDAALAAFAEDAVAEHRVRGENYQGLHEIRKLLEGISRNGRRLDIVRVATEGNRVTVQAEISDGGMVWGTETFVLEMKDDKVQSFSVTGVRLELWKIRR